MAFPYGLQRAMCCVPPAYYHHHMWSISWVYCDTGVRYAAELKHSNFFLPSAPRRLKPSHYLSSCTEQYMCVHQCIGTSLSQLVF